MTNGIYECRSWDSNPGSLGYKSGTYTYGAPGTRNFNFDVDFLLPDKLPPGTPMFRDVNTLTFRQLLRPNQ